MAQPTWIGQTLNGRYYIEELLGQGGMSAVYKASDPNLKRVVAIKLIHPHLAGDPSFVQRFKEEATAVASLRHPNIVQVYDFNSDQDVSYMVLEFIPGETLQDNLKRLSGQKRNMDVSQAVKITIEICDALNYAHQRGMIHRDIKPANIMLDVYGHAILMDFGIVKIVGGTQHTATGAVMGTARYMSPELIRSESADQRSDIYSLGVTLYEMLSGKTPFEADSAMTLMMMHLNDPVPDPRKLRQDLPPALVTILNRSLAKDRNQRYASAAVMASDLKQVLSNLQTDQNVSPQPVTVLPDERTQTYHPNQDTATLYQQAARNPSPPGGYSAPIPRPTPTMDYSQPYVAPEKKRMAGGWWFAIGGVALLFLVGLVMASYLLILRPLLGNNGAKPTPLAGVISQGDVTPDLGAAISLATPTRTAISSFSATLTANALFPPTQVNTAASVVTDTPSPTATATMPPLYVRINSITLSAGYTYVVDYETFGYTEKLPGMHVHFFFNTVSPDQAGMPGNGPWVLYGGPRPFTRYTISDRPAKADQICALVANADHTVIPESGNCMALP